MNNISDIKLFCEKNNISHKLGEKLSAYCTFKTGGKAEIIIEPSSADELGKIIAEIKKQCMNYIVLGRGSNVLFPDSGTDDVVILLGEKFSQIKLISEDEIFCQSGVSLTRLCNFACENSLTGMEFAYGIPGTVGGAVYMNAGAYGGEIKDIITKAEHLEENGVSAELAGAELEMDYRKSVYTDTGKIITGAYFKLKKGDRQQMQAKMDEIMGQRRAKQPLEYPSAGSTFKRPEGAFASALIDGCGLKGFSVGGAQVSEKHAGFIINRDGAASSDILALMAEVTAIVKEKTGYVLEPEIKIY